LPAFPAAPPVFATPGAELGEIVWTTAVDPSTNTPLDPVEWFPVDVETIYAVIPAWRLEAGVAITAEWTYNDTPVPGLGDQVTPAESYVDAWIEFHITQAPDTPWPTGVYRITIFVGGQPAVSSEVEVRDSSDSER
jgi:hypothetical protein